MIYNAKENLKSTNKYKLQMSSYTISVNSQCKHRLKWLSWRKHWENRVQLTSISVSTKGENKQVQYNYPYMLYIYKMCPKSAQTVSKCWDDKAAVGWKFGHCSGHTSLKIWTLIIWWKRKMFINFIKCYWILNVVCSFKIYFSFPFCSYFNLEATVVKTDAIRVLKQLFTSCFLLIGKKNFQSDW